MFSSLKWVVETILLLRNQNRYAKQNVQKYVQNMKLQLYDLFLSSCQQ